MPATLTITIKRINGTICVDWTGGANCRKAGDSPCVTRAMKVRWQAGEGVPGTWIVVFCGDSPFKKRITFDPADPEGVITADAALAEYKYDVLVRDEAGKFHQLDPKIMVQEDDMGAPSQYEAYSYRLDAFAEDAEAVAAEARELAEIARNLPGSRGKASAS